MPIDFATERAISILEAAEMLPKNKNGKPFHSETIMRWMHDGLKSRITKQSIKLEHGYIGRMLFTTREAVQRFIAMLNGMPYSVPTAPTRVPNGLPAGSGMSPPSDRLPAGQANSAIANNSRGFSSAVDVMLKITGSKQKSPPPRTRKPKTLKPTAKTA